MTTPRGLALVFRLLPRDVRDEFADEMTAVFEADLRDHPGAPGRVSVWTRTVASMVWLAVALQARRTRADLRDAWRAVAARPAPAAPVVAILALAFGPIAVVFALADAVVFRPLPFPDPDRQASATLAAVVAPMRRAGGPSPPGNSPAIEGRRGARAGAARVRVLYLALRTHDC